MHEPIAATRVQTVIALARLSAAVDACFGVIAGFALLAGARAFMFIALLGWREPVLGGAGLVLLAVVGWLRWQCGAAAAAIAASQDAPLSRSAMSRAGAACNALAAAPGRAKPRCPQARDVACYNRPARCDARESS
jgi:hypothetical protein